MRFEEHPELATEIFFLARQPLPISLIEWNRFLRTIDQALRTEYTNGVGAAPTLEARNAVLESPPGPPDPPDGRLASSRVG